MKLTPTAIEMKRDALFARPGVGGSGRQAIARFNRGFTLIEMMVTVVIAVVLAAVAVPYLGDFIGRSRARGVSSELESALQYARVEAIARSTDVEVCAASQPLSNPESAECASGAGAGNAWGNGWLVRLVRKVDGETRLLRTSTELPPDIQITHIDAGSPGRLVFSRTGLTGRQDDSRAGGALIVGRTVGSRFIAETCLRIDALGGRIRRGKPTAADCS